jgi:hypothetical protein
VIALQVRAVPRLALAVALLAGLALAACGGGGQAPPEQTIRDFVAATNARDGDRLCGKVLSREYMEKATGASGDAVEKACKTQLSLVKGLRLKLVSVGRAKVNGDRATVRAVLLTSGQRTPRVFSLVHEDGAWKLVSGESG